jgi:hypothetical protein
MNESFSGLSRIAKEQRIVIPKQINMLSSENLSNTTSSDGIKITYGAIPDIKSIDQYLSAHSH